MCFYELEIKSYFCNFFFEVIMSGRPGTFQHCMELERGVYARMPARRNEENFTAVVEFVAP